MSEIFSEATEEYANDEEEEYLCPVECQRFAVEEEDCPTHEVQCVREDIFQGMNELEDKRVVERLEQG